MKVTNAFKIDKVDTRKAILAKASAVDASGKYTLALMKNESPFVDVVFEFAQISGAKFKCFALGRADRYEVFQK